MSEKLFWVDICLCLYHMTASCWVCTNSLSTVYWCYMWCRNSIRGTQSI